MCPTSSCSRRRAVHLRLDDQAEAKLLPVAEQPLNRSFAARIRPTYSDLPLCHHDKTAVPATYVFGIEEFVCPSDQILSTGRLQTYQYNPNDDCQVEIYDCRRNPDLA